MNSTDSEPGGSGVEQITYSAAGAQTIPSTNQPGATASFVISTEGVTNLGFFGTDNAGNIESSHSLTINLDKAPPDINCAAPDALWHATDVSIGCRAEDSLSGLAIPSDVSFALFTAVPNGTETASAQTGTYNVCDVAGNCAVAGPVTGIKVDKKPPSITVTTPANAASYLLDQSTTAAYICSDGGSGVASCVGTVANGSALNTSSVGSKTFSVTGTDNVGNSTTNSDIYSVLFASGGTCDGDAGHQILQPIPSDGTGVFKQGRTIPAKFRVCDANGVSIGTPGVVGSFFLTEIISGTVTTTVQDIVDSTNPDTAFRWDPSGQQWIFNISTSNLAANFTYIYTITLNDGTFIHFQYGLR